MENIIHILENKELINGISLVISVVIPILVMIVTLYVGGKRAKKENAIKDFQFRETLKENEIHHKESLELQEENNRCSQLPFLFLNQDFKIGNRDGKCFFPLEIINLGNGTALEVSVKWESDRNGNDINGWPFVYRKQMGERIEIYRYTGFLFTNVLPINSKAAFELLVDIYDHGKEIMQEEKNITGEVRFTIKYKDTHYNEYEQDYMFQYSTRMGIGRVESYLPRLVKRFIERDTIS